MTAELAKTYDPKSVEREIYDLWIASGAFNAEPDSDRPPYCIVIPPPNVTAALHAGHALNNTLQDILVRFKRMQQYNALWMPGSDHAGIATQTVVEKQILAEEGKKRTDFQRDEFIGRVRAWKDRYEARIIDQLKRMGCSCDWRRTRFTMDDICARAVREAFFRLFSDGLIYRGKRLVNWDPATQTVLADDEVEYEQVHGNFWYLRYPLVEPCSTGVSPVADTTITYVTVATTRPETMLGDTAIAMNPADPRAKALVGKKVRLPIVGRIIPIIADEHVVLPDPDSEDEKAKFGTGFLKVTPAHDFDDEAIGRRHDLPIINVLAPDGSISDRHGWDDCDTPEAQNLIGMDRFEARKAIVEWFRTEDLLEDVREYVHPVGHSYRSHVPIEPYRTDQWYIAVKKPISNLKSQISNLKSQISDWPAEHLEHVEEKNDIAYLKDTDVPVNSLAGLALTPLLDGRLKFTPDRYANTYKTWLENLRDWPISRQLWWGHRIPVWSKPGDHSELAENNDAIRSQVIEGEEGPVTYLCVAANEELEGSLEAKGFTRDPDVLDTWFSSALWPFSTLKWPAESEDLKTFYPGDVLSTAREIITLWVSRMVMMGQYCLGKPPFHDVFIHAMIQDGQGRKMSKSLGNGIDPLDIIDSHGADAMRFTLASMTTQTQDVRMPVEEMTLPDGRKANSSPKFDIGRNFCNKLWNTGRFILMNLRGAPPWSDIRPSERLADRWILSRLNATIRDVTSALETFRFNELTDRLYHFMWDDLCDWYVEIAKSRINAGETAPKTILAHCLDVLLRLLHPLCPFITEAIWAKLNEVAPVRGAGDEPAEEMLVGGQWPCADAAGVNVKAEQQFATLQEIVRQVRNARMQHGVKPGKKIDAIVETSEQSAELLAANVDLLRSAAHLADVKIATETVSAPPGAASVVAGDIRVCILGIVDRQAELARLEKQAETLRKGIGGIEGKLSNENFLKKAPPDVVNKERERLRTLHAELKTVEKSLDALGS